MTPTHDAVVVGGGAAGLTAALWLGRYRRRTLVIDGGEQRNLSARASHGYLTRDGGSPAEFLDAARGDLDRYPTIEIVSGSVAGARRAGAAFELTTATQRYVTQRVLFATGVRDVWPEIPGFESLYGRAIFHCSCCDGYEARDESVLAIGWGEHVSGYALDLLEWGARVTLVTDGRPFEGDDASSVALRKHDVEILEDPVEEFLVEGESMAGARLRSGRTLRATKAFFSIAHEPRHDLPRALGCTLDEGGYVTVDDHGQTSVEGVYAAGDITPGEQLVQAAAAEGAIAGIDCAVSLRGGRTAPGAPEPGPDPTAQIDHHP
ncbi:MAG: NAD(P)/FAD-dependent oxidoreductase [Actinomycetota bacterium]